MSSFQNPTADLASSNSQQNLNYQENWVLSRTLDGLTQKAGVSLNKLARLAMKELIDNSLDALDAHGGDGVDVGTLPNGGYYIDDKGPGIDGSPMDIAWLFSIRRPMASSKYLRLPTRGAVGNGLRVVAGAVLASGGSLTITTRNQRIELRPERNGSTTVVGIKTVKRPVGVRIEISFGSGLPHDANALGWARQARKLAEYGSGYSGKSSPWWYDGAQFHELLDVNGDRPVRDLISQLDGCTGNKAGEIVTTAGLNRATCRSVTQTQAGRLLRVAQDSTRQVKPKRLGAVGPDAFAGAYACAHGVGEETPITNIPFLVEAWAEALEDDDDTSLSVYVNRTPVTGDIDAVHNRKDIDFYGCGLADTVAVTTKDARVRTSI